MKHQNLLRLTALLLLTYHSCLPAAETPFDGTGERVVYDAGFFAPFAPRTALDMVKQTPGFVLADPEQELRRGFSGAVGNVLIDGQRLTAKSQTLADVLQRVPAGEVLRVEILRGNAVAGDASGAAVLANVVRTAVTGGGAWGLGFELANQDEPAPNGFFAWSGRRGITEYSIGGNSYSLERNLPGTRSVYDSAGHLTSRRFETSPRDFAEYALNGQLARPLSGGRLTVTGQAAYSRYHDDSTLLTTSLSGAQLEDESIPYTESDRVGEFGIGWQSALGVWDTEFNALLTRKRHRNHLSVTHFDAADVQDSLFRRAVEQDSGESILRATLARDLRGGRLEAGGELAVNTLDGHSRLTLDLGGGPFEIPVPNHNLRVRENRVELFVSHSLPLAQSWSLETRLAAEASRLDFSGDTEQSVSLSYLKPRVQLTRTFGPHQVQIRAFRDVSQLDFTDFVSTVELEDEVIDGGNPQLRPQTAWAAEVIGDFRLGATVWRARLFRHWLDDVKDLIPIVTPTRRFDAPGNIGRGALHGAELNLRLPVAFLPGGTFSASGTLQHAQVRDPVTGEHRTISALVERQLKAELRQDLQAAKVAWGVSYTGESAATTWRFLETDRKGKSSSLDLFIETAVPFTPRGGLKLRLAMLSALDDPETRLRRFYLPDRAGTFLEIEAGARQPGHRWLLSASGSF